MNFQIPASENYLNALGRAAYNFVYLEWNIIWLGECMDRGFIQEAKMQTAGKIGTSFQRVIQTKSFDVELTKKLNETADNFLTLCDLGNDLLHGTPYTASDGEQRLKYSGKRPNRDWTIESVLEAAVQFENLAISSGRLLHQELLPLYNKS